ncbi:hypothetical protein AB0I34_40455 [Kribbella sp. NPDC050281]|uniref:hypothetical protein n=1 Tax=Kribbella sp. NPDC050281 TaxID=3155515 RepID=UPI0033F9D96F
MTTQSATSTDSAGVYRAIHWGFVALFGSGAVIHFVLALTTPQSYRPFADGALFDWVYHGWQNVFTAHPTLWALLLAVAELTIAILLVKSPRTGYLAVIAFHLALMCFGWASGSGPCQPCASRSQRPGTPSGSSGSANVSGFFVLLNSGRIPRPKKSVPPASGS